MCKPNKQPLKHGLTEDEKNNFHTLMLWRLERVQGVMLTWFYEIHMCLYIHMYTLNYAHTNLKYFSS